MQTSNHDIRRQTEVLIIGQGICGTFLSWELERAGISYIVIDEARTYTASKAAAGLINPVTGRRLVTTWMIDELLPFAQEFYGRIGQALGVSILEEKEVIDFFPTAQMRLAFLDRYQEDPHYLKLPANEHDLDDVFRYELGYGVISPCYLVDLPGLLAAARKRLQEQGVLREERFELDALKTDVDDASKDIRSSGSGSIRYKDIEARKVIFCDGIESFSNPYFSRLPFAPNKGEALIIDIPGMGDHRNAIFKKGISLAPWKDGLYWVGSSYEWSFTDVGPTEVFRKKTEAALGEWLKLPFHTVEHISSVRPATLERRPFVGFHPLHPAVGILNGMGTKGCSLAPYFAHQLVENITKTTMIRPDADVKRFTKILSR